MTNIEASLLRRVSRIGSWRLGSLRYRLRRIILPSSTACLSCGSASGPSSSLRERNRGGPRFCFIDGPITANNPMGVHHAWGRTLKDIYQRYNALHGFDQRYQNGFDCQGLWVEVEVEKALGLNSKREIEAYGLDKFARACRDRVAKYGEVQTEQSSASASGWTGTTTTTRCPTPTSRTSGLPQAVHGAAGCTSATAR